MKLNDVHSGSCGPVGTYAVHMLDWTNCMKRVFHIWAWLSIAIWIVLGLGFLMPISRKLGWRLRVTRLNLQNPLRKPDDSGLKTSLLSSTTNMLKNGHPKWVGKFAHWRKLGRNGWLLQLLHQNQTSLPIKFHCLSTPFRSMKLQTVKWWQAESLHPSLRNPWWKDPAGGIPKAMTLHLMFPLLTSFMMHGKRTEIVREWKTIEYPHPVGRFLLIQHLLFPSRMKTLGIELPAVKNRSSPSQARSPTSRRKLPVWSPHSKTLWKRPWNPIPGHLWVSSRTSLRTWKPHHIPEPKSGIEGEVSDHDHPKPKIRMRSKI